MKQSEINFKITLDENNLPEKIDWSATEGAEKSSSKAVMIALWDAKENNTLRIDLWTKDMEVHEMKRFCIEIINGLADTIRNATNDEIMAMDMENLCIKMEKRLKSEIGNK